MFRSLAAGQSRFIFKFVSNIATSAVLLLALGIAGTPSAQGVGTVVSYDPVVAGDAVTRGGTTVRPSDLVDLGSNTLVFDEFGTNPFVEDLDAAYVRANGNVIFSTDTDVNQAFPGLPTGFLNGDLIEWDGVQGSVLFSESNFTSGTNPNISAVHLFETGPNAGKLVLGTSGANDVLGGEALEWGNLVLYDPGSDTSTLFFDQDLISGTLTQRVVDAVHVLPNGHLLLSTNIDNGFLGGLQLKAKDIVEYDPVADSTAVFRNGTNVFDGSTRNLNAVYVPEPGTLVLLGIGLAGLAAARRLQTA